MSDRLALTVTSDQLAAWHAYLETGSMAKAARKLGVHRDTVWKRIAALKDVYEVQTMAQLAVALQRAEVA